MTRVFQDANVLFSAARPGSLTDRLLVQADRRVALVVSPGVAEEASRNLAAKRPDDRSGLARWLDRCGRVGDVLFLVPEADGLHDADRAVLCAAIRGRCQHLVTGDKRHFGVYFGRAVQGVTILNPAGLAKLLATTPPRDRR